MIFNELSAELSFALFASTALSHSNLQCAQCPTQP